MDDDIWQEEMRKERCSSPSIEDEDMDEEGGQSEAAHEDKQPEGGEMEHETVQEMGDAEESQLILTKVNPTAAPAISFPCNFTPGPLRSCCTCSSGTVAPATLAPSGF